MARGQNPRRPRRQRQEVAYHRPEDFSLWPRKLRKNHIVFEFEEWGLSETRKRARQDF